MNTAKYKILLYTITGTLLFTLLVQFYWNYKNYLTNKQNFINQVQICLDNALEDYYENLAEDNQIAIMKTDSTRVIKNTDSIFKEINIEVNTTKKAKTASSFTQFSDSTSGTHYNLKNNSATKVHIFNGKKASDSLKLINDLKIIYITILNDTLNFKTLNTILKNEFNRKQFNIPYALKHFKKDSLINEYNQKIVTSTFLKTKSNSRLKQDEFVELNYPNATTIILKEGFLGILLSTLLCIVILTCLFYLLYIIKKQKQISEIKNDLISNITHEFKTPITTIGVALESIKNFNILNDKTKTETYLDISTVQLSKLNIMVEKLLETAILDSNNLNLNLSKVNITALLESIVNKHQIQIKDKQINLKQDSKLIFSSVDEFHMENAINNIIDNAIKYGGNTIYISLETTETDIQLSISDTGNTISKEHQDKIFEKFYRIQKGNTHNTKGFGIGLYYAKKIITHHHGTLNLELKNKLTTFKITLPNG